MNLSVPLNLSLPHKWWYLLWMPALQRYQKMRGTLIVGLWLHHIHSKTGILMFTYIIFDCNYCKIWCYSTFANCVGVWLERAAGRLRRQLFSNTFPAQITFVFGRRSIFSPPSGCFEFAWVSMRKTERRVPNVCFYLCTSSHFSCKVLL